MKLREAGQVPAKPEQPVGSPPGMHVVLAITGLAIAIFFLRDAFDAMLVPGRVKRRLRLVPSYFHGTWAAWSAIARRIGDEERRERYLSVYGPLSMLTLFVIWIGGVLLGLSLLQLGLTPGDAPRNFSEAVFVTGARMFTITTGDWAKDIPVSKALAVMDAGLGLGFVTIVITYMPVLYQLFARREAHVVLLDERAGRPVTAVSLLCNHSRLNAMERLDNLLGEWEQWSAELLESHVSYPMLSYYRSQHSDESWLSAMAVIMDTCALRIAGLDSVSEFQAEATLAICISALTNIGDILRVQPCRNYRDRLADTALEHMLDDLRSRNVRLPSTHQFRRQLHDVRCRYEPLLAGLAEHLVIDLPAWVPDRVPDSPLDATVV